MFYIKYTASINEQSPEIRAQTKERIRERMWDMKTTLYANPITPLVDQELKFYQISYTTNIGGGFFFYLKEKAHQIEHEHNPPFTITAGTYGLATKAARRSSKNLISWWHYVFEELLVNNFYLDKEYHEIKSYCLIIFWRINNLSLRYLFVTELFMRGLDDALMFYFFKYNFFRKTLIRKRTPNIKKYQLKRSYHVDRYTRREFWIHTL